MLALFGVMSLVGLLDATVVALVLPMVQSIIHPELLEKSAIFGKAAAWLGLEWNATAFVMLAVVLALLIVVSAVAVMLVSWMGDVQAARCRNRLGSEIVQRLLDAPYLWHTRNNSAVLARQVFSDVGVWRQDYLQSLLQLGQAIPLIVIPAVVVVVMAPSRGLLALAVAGSVAATTIMVLRPRVQKIAKLQKNNLNATMRILLQLFTGIREIKVSNRAAYFARRFDYHHGLGNDYGVTQKALSSLGPSVVLTLGQVGFIVTAILLWQAQLSGAEIAAQLAMLGVVVSRIIPTVNRATTAFNNLVRSLPVVEGLIRTLRDIDKATESYGRRLGGQPVPEQWGVVRFENVSFCYPEAKANSLEGLVLELHRGCRYGVVGSSGAGKSTLVNLLLGLVEPSEGVITVDGHPLREIDLNQWQEQIGYVPQDVFLLDDSLRANIAFGDCASEHDDSSLWEALQKARLDEVVKALPQGLNTQMGERGRRLSGGQAQRVAIARALLRSPNIVLLDEATSALDSVTEADIQASFDRLSENVLAIAVAHRITSLRNCHSILVLEGGRLQDMGTYEELLDRNVLFRELAAHPSRTNND